ncbi:MAG: hypothetical protein A3G34_09830 [Candidatus Lindowbacteria bacterium RIFCSPLOWO2_12_FULL_62_27]|nr:MAG: hypothetical protein A3G34_09830 [Candidatus Lindowbacteria bacterium RIFCSPLOWO2_12_FULL_62_27]OGH61543.1 MAG: hypothetical protein A3I06_02835 [Candidatus Lindowbacteria bacterium RIFCSPLOWO2_02_FULL_62_12]
MKKYFSIYCACLAAFVFLLSATNPVPAADKKKAAEPDALPILARGFAGTLEGKVLTKDDTGTAFVIKVEKVKTVPKYAQWNKAKKPDALKGKKVMIHVRWFEDKDSKKYKPGEDFVKWVNGLKIDRAAAVDVYSDGYSRLIMVEAPKK